MTKAFSTFRPFLAEHPDPKYPMKWPKLASPKYDGIRIFIHPTLGPVTRSLKPLPNKRIRELLAKLPAGLDGELLIGNPDDRRAFSKTGTLRAHDDIPEEHVVFMTFDYSPPENVELTYKERYRQMVIMHSTHELIMQELSSAIRLYWEPTPYKQIDDEVALWAFYDECLAKGYEGAILRDPQGHYKFGRSTAKEQNMLKMKPFLDAEAVVIGFEPLMENQNEATIDALGLQKRSSHKAGKVAQEMVGKLLVRGINGQFKGVEFKVGSGFNDEMRDHMFRDFAQYNGSLLTYTYQPHGSVDKPRCPIFKGWRMKEDL
jgi:DNA ligase 1